MTLGAGIALAGLCFSIAMVTVGVMYIAYLQDLRVHGRSK